MTARPAPIGAAVVRPEPGNARTVARLRAHGIDTLAMPMFRVTPLDWQVPDLIGFDRLLLTSANAVRHGGAGLAALRHLPVIAVGETTAAAARAAGFKVATTGQGDVAAALRAAGPCRALHIAGRDHRASGAATVVVYASEPCPVDQAAWRACRGRVVLLHSARAAMHLGERVREERGGIALAALSPAIADAAGPGWAWRLAPPRPDDAALVALVAERLTGRVRARISGP